MPNKYLDTESLRAIKTYVEGLTPTNLENGTGENSLQQKQDGTSGTFDFTNKNPNATALDSTLTGQLAYGAIGDYATSFGGKSQASGKRSFAQGTTTIAKGKYSHAEGDNSVAYADDSHAEGFATLSAGLASHTEGSKTQVLTTLPESGGGGDTPVDPPSGFLPDDHRGEASHAEGSLTVVYGFSSHAEGANTIVKGHYAHAEGVSTMAVGAGSKSYGNHSTANGDYSVAGGSYTTANQIGSFAHGYGASTYAEYSTAFGDNTQTVRRAQFAIGSYNIGRTTTLFEVGNGTSSSRGNAFEVYSDGHATVGGKNVLTDELNLENGTGTNAIQEKMADATVNFADDGTGHSRNPNATTIDPTLLTTINTGASGNQSSAFGKNTMALSTASSTFGNKTIAKGEESMAQGYQSVTLGDGSHAEGEQTTSAGSVSHSEGSNTVAIGVASHAEGVRSKTQPISGVTDSATGAHAEGESTIASGYCSHTEGFGSYTGPIANAPSYPITPEPEPSPEPSPTPVIPLGNLAHAEGNYCFAIGTGSHAEGYHTQALHEASHAEGVGTKTYRSGQLVAGWYNATPASNDLFVIGNGTADNARSNIFVVSLDGKVTAPTFVGNLNGNASTATNATYASSADNATLAQTANLVMVNPDSSYVGAILVNSNTNQNTIVRKDNITVTADGRLTIAHDPINNMDVVNKGFATNLLSPSLVGAGTTANITLGDGPSHNGFEIDLGTTSYDNGLYIFTYGNCMVMLPIYNAQLKTVYHTSATLVNSSGSFAVKDLRYMVYDWGSAEYGYHMTLKIWEANDYMPIGYTGYLFKIKLY